MDLLMISLPAAKHAEKIYTWAMHTSAFFAFVSIIGVFSILLALFYYYMSDHYHSNNPRAIASAIFMALFLCLFDFSMFNLIHDSNEQSYAQNVQSYYIIHIKTHMTKNPVVSAIKTVENRIPNELHHTGFHVQKPHWWNWL